MTRNENHAYAALEPISRSTTRYRPWTGRAAKTVRQSATGDVIPPKNGVEPRGRGCGIARNALDLQHAGHEPDAATAKAVMAAATASPPMATCPIRTQAMSPVVDTGSSPDSDSPLEAFEDSSPDSASEPDHAGDRVESRAS